MLGGGRSSLPGVVQHSISINQFEPGIQWMHPAHQTGKGQRLKGRVGRVNEDDSLFFSLIEQA